MSTSPRAGTTASIQAHGEQRATSGDDKKILCLQKSGPDDRYSWNDCGGDKMKTLSCALSQFTRASNTHTRQCTQKNKLNTATNMLKEKNAGSYGYICPLFLSLPIGSLQTTCAHSLEFRHPPQAHARSFDKKNSDHVLTLSLGKMPQSVSSVRMITTSRMQHQRTL